MKFGIGLTGFAQQPAGSDMADRFDKLVRAVHLIDELGFDYVTIGQHFLTDPLQALQPLPVLARLVPESRRLRFVTTVVAPLHSPVYLAESLATLDVLSDGRVGVNLALGYRDVEYHAFGLVRSHRARRFEATVPVLLALWEGRLVTSRTPWWTLEDARIAPRPLQRPHPPVWIAASADAAVRRAARWGLPWNISSHANRPTIIRQVGIYRAAAAEAGHDPAVPLPMARELFCGPTRRQAFDSARQYVTGKYDSYAQWGQHEALPDHDDFRAPIRELAADRFIIGSPADCLRELSSYRRLGVEHVHLRMTWPGMPLATATASIRRFAAEVMPAFVD